MEVHQRVAMVDGHMSDRHTLKEHCVRQLDGCCAHHIRVDIRTTHPNLIEHVRGTLCETTQLREKQSASTAACGAVVCTCTVWVGMSTVTCAAASTDWIALVTLRAQPPQVMLSM